MSSTAFNLLLAFLLLAANAFYVAAEFALVKSRGFRVKAMVEQNKFGSRLLQAIGRAVVANDVEPALVRDFLQQKLSG